MKQKNNGMRRFFTLPLSHTATGFVQNDKSRKLFLFFCAAVFFFSCKKSANTDPATLPNGYSNQSIGASANDLLSAGTYTTLTIQIQYMPGYEPDTNAINNVQGYLESLCNKPGGIFITEQQIAGANGDTLNPEAVGVLEKQYRTAYTSGNTLALYILVTDGHDSAASVLGFAYRNTSICLFGKTIFGYSGGLGEPSRVALESSVLEHELGHILGLVNTGTPMVTNHEDPNHSKHCNNVNCLMYYAIDINSPGSIFHPNYIPSLDSNCRKDLKANGGK